MKKKRKCFHSDTNDGGTKREKREQKSFCFVNDPFLWFNVLLPVPFCPCDEFEEALKVEKCVVRKFDGV